MLPRNFLNASITVQPNFSIRTVFTPTSVVAYQIQYEIVKKGKERGVGGGGLEESTKNYIHVRGMNTQNYFGSASREWELEASIAIPSVDDASFSLRFVALGEDLQFVEVIYLRR